MNCNIYGPNSCVWLAESLTSQPNERDEANEENEANELQKIIAKRK